VDYQKPEYVDNGDIEVDIVDVPWYTGIMIRRDMTLFIGTIRTSRNSEQ
jgi:hypothetical protein